MRDKLATKLAGMDCDDCVVCGPGDCNCDCCPGDCCCLYGASSSPSTNCWSCCCSSHPNPKCCCIFVTALVAIAVATLIVVLVVAYAVVFPARVTVEDAYLRRFALADDNFGNFSITALAYDVSLAVAVRNRDFAPGGVWSTAPLDAELRFLGQTFARATAKLESAEWGLFKARGKGVYRVTASSPDSGALNVLVGGDAVAEFVRESVAGVFELELVVVGGEVVNKDDDRHHGRDSSGVVSATCPLKLSFPTTATANVEFTRVKCTSS